MNSKIATPLFFLFILSSCSTAFINSGTLPGTGTELTVSKSLNYEGSQYFSYKVESLYKLSDQDLYVFTNRIETQLKQKLLYQENTNKVIEITFDNYVMRDNSTRFVAGVFAGIDNITTSVVIKDKNSKKILGAFQVISKNATAWGSTNSLLEQHADKIISYLK